ncbi:MAG: AAA family ATPase, partial [Magnetococcales bacterium]|nr:AAA family ATPase [Magnetococcales bacterium]
MRIERLYLERFGHFTDLELDFSDPGVGLWLVLGNNEAGKSTALTAIGDLLFGIPERTPFNFRHDYRDLRIGARIVAEDGTRLEFLRRKGHKAPLTDRRGTPLGEGTLAPFLGAADRDLFDTLLGLSQAGLRAGGQEMLKARGAVGEMLFGAGGGLHNPVALANRLEEETGRIFTPGRKSANREFYQALEACETAGRGVRERLVAMDTWRDNRRELDRLEQERQLVRETMAGLEAVRRRVTRIKTVQPLGRQLEQLDRELEGLAAVPLLAADVESRFRAAEQALLLAGERERESRRAAEQAREAAARL